LSAFLCKSYYLETLFEGEDAATSYYLAPLLEGDDPTRIKRIIE